MHPGFTGFAQVVEVVAHPFPYSSPLAPSPIPGLVEGVLPPLLLATLFSMLPMMLRGLAWYECIPKHSLVSISVYRRFFLFLLVHGFLIVMISSSLTELIQDIIDQPTQTVQKIAQMLPSASVFFLTYMLTQGLAGAGAAMAQFYPLIIHFIHKWLLLRTPRQAFGVSFLMPSADFALILPRLSLLATIGFAYSVLNPVVDLFALLSYSMFYLAFKLLLTQVYDQRAEDETGGMYFPMAISNLFGVIGLYIAQICLASLFFLKASVSSVSFIAMGLLMLVLISLTGLAHFLLSRRFEPIAQFLPMSLATKDFVDRFDRQSDCKAKLADVQNANEDLAPGSVRRRVSVLLKRPGRALEGAAASSVERRVEQDAVDLSDDDSSRGEAQEQEFDHPSVHIQQPWIWIPADRLGLSKLFVERPQRSRG
ncbi:DUF221 family protein [Mycena venus]|uniref:DUF221 family protein n=1 Tax=Mycena venus TaxID=2733690 RepID=A0A8H6TSF5_9AGAR|nr:DUF221 family protein [Mycena venus]